MSYEFKGSTPCNNCPYRKDAPLQKWSIKEFEDLLAADKLLFSPVYGCHKKNGTICKGCLMNQDERAFPNLSLRMELSRQKVVRKYLDSLKCKSERYATVEEMSIANYPELE